MKKKHRYYNAYMGRKYVRPAGYVAGDAWYGNKGTYYLGSGRRRIGAGFAGRRWAHHEKKVAMKKHREHLSERKKKAAKKRVEKQMKANASKHRMLRMELFRKKIHRTRRQRAAERKKKHKKKKRSGFSKLKDFEKKIGVKGFIKGNIRIVRHY